jgi:hypothetical protein
VVIGATPEGKKELASFTVRRIATDAPAVRDRGCGPDRRDARNADSDSDSDSDPDIRQDAGKDAALRWQAFALCADGWADGEYSDRATCGPTRLPWQMFAPGSVISGRPRRPPH